MRNFLIGPASVGRVCDRVTRGASVLRAGTGSGLQVLSHLACALRAGSLPLTRYLAIVLASAYMLRLFQTIMNGPEVPDLPERRDLTWTEALAVAPLVAGFVLLGVNPGPVVTVAEAAAHLAVPGAPTLSHAPAAPEDSRVVGSR